MLWIATQDDKSLMNVKEVTVDGKRIEGLISSTAMNHWSKTLGKYESEERALGVLDEMFTQIEEVNGNIVAYTMPKK